MSKLQEALSKLQRGRASAPATPPAPEDPSPTLARPGEALRPPAGPPDGAHRRPHAYGGAPLGVDRQAFQRAGLLASQGQERRVADEYRQIKRPLIRNAAAAPGQANLLVVVSALSGEGKTFTCMNLCLSLASEKDWSVVLVDADVAKPHVSRMFGIEDRPGLLDLLRDDSLSFDALVCPTDVPGFAILPAGARDELAAELLASERMTTICAGAAAADKRRLIVFDSPPLLQTSEAPVLASHAGQIVMIVQADRTSQAQVGQALANLDERITTSLVLNQAKAGGDLVYGDYYGSGYGQHDGRDSAGVPGADRA